MNKLYLLLGWYGIVIIGMSQLIFDGTTTSESLIGLVVLLGVPTGIYYYHTQKKKAEQNQILK